MRQFPRLGTFQTGIKGSFVKVPSRHQFPPFTLHLLDFARPCARAPQKERPFPNRLLLDSITPEAILQLHRIHRSDLFIVPAPKKTPPHSPTQFLINFFYLPMVKISCAVMLLVKPRLNALARRIVGLVNWIGFLYSKSEAVGAVPSKV